MIYSGTGDRWHNIAEISLTSTVLYDSPDWVMEIVHKYSHSHRVLTWYTAP